MAGISKDFFLADHALLTHPEPTVAENGSIFPQWHHITCGHRGGRPKAEEKSSWILTRRLN